MPLLTSLLIIFLIWILIWFFKGEVFGCMPALFWTLQHHRAGLGVGTINRNRPKYSFFTTAVYRHEIVRFV